MENLYEKRSPNLSKILNKPFGFFLKFGLIIVIIIIVTILSLCLSKKEFIQQKIYCYHCVCVENNFKGTDLVYFYTHQQFTKWLENEENVEWCEASTHIKGDVISMSYSRGGCIIAVRLKMKGKINPKKGYLIFRKKQSYYRAIFKQDQ